ncbi:MAG: ATP-dependent metallopeptidase FtsH/Yme1/Tma family protein [bacterium]
MKYLNYGFVGIVIVTILGVLNLSSTIYATSEKAKVIPYSQFLDDVEANRVKEIGIDCRRKIEGVYTDGSGFFITQIPESAYSLDPTLIERIRKNGVEFYAMPAEEGASLLFDMITSIIPAVLIFTVFMIFVMIILFNRRWGLLRKTIVGAQFDCWEKIPKQMDEIIKRFDSLIL